MDVKYCDKNVKIMETINETNKSKSLKYPLYSKKKLYEKAVRRNISAPNIPYNCIFDKYMSSVASGSLFVKFSSEPRKRKGSERDATSEVEDAPSSDADKTSNPKSPRASFTTTLKATDSNVGSLNEASDERVPTRASENIGQHSSLQESQNNWPQKDKSKQALPVRSKDEQLKSYQMKVRTSSP